MYRLVSFSEKSQNGMLVHGTLVTVLKQARKNWCRLGMAGEVFRPDGTSICEVSDRMIWRLPLEPDMSVMQHKKGWRVIGRHRWVAGAKISESAIPGTGWRRFTATIRGWRNWKIAVNHRHNERQLGYVLRRVRWIRDLIDMGNEDIFNHVNDWKMFD